MQTCTHRLGGTPEPITLLQDDGTPYDLSGATVTIQVQSGAVCVVVPVTQKKS